MPGKSYEEVEIPAFEDEYELEEYCCEHARRVYGLGNLKVEVEGENGWPDRIFFGVLRGMMPRRVVFFVEFKDEGEKPSGQQLLRHGEIEERYSVDVYTCDSFSTFERILSAMML